MARRYNVITKYVIEAECSGPLHIGSAEGGKEEVLVHPVSREPFIQASSLAGVFREYCSEELKNDIYGADRLSENTNAVDYQSMIKFSDGYFKSDSLKLELRPHVSINRKTGSVSSKNSSGQKFNYEYIGAGSEFYFSVYMFSEKLNGAVDHIAEIEREFAAMKEGSIRFGGKKSSGAGIIAAKKIQKITFDMTNPADRLLWMDEEYIERDKYQDITDKLVTNSATKYAYQIKIEAETEGAVQVRGIAVDEFGKGSTDSKNMKNAKGQFIVPGSSLKGSIRSQMEKIAGYIGTPELISNCFGEGGVSGGEGKRGNLMFADIVIADRKDNSVIRHRTHIDKFTGGVFYKGLFSEQNVSGEMDIEIDILDIRNAEASLALLLMALRDMAVGVLSLGNGYNSGKGFVKIKGMTIKANNGDIAKWDSRTSTFENDAFIENAFNALSKVKGGVN